MIQIGTKIKKKLKSLIVNNSSLLDLLLQFYNRLPFNNVFRIRGEVKHVGAILTHCKFDSYGKNNSIGIAPRCQLRECRIHIGGSNNRVFFDGFVSARGLDIWIEDDGNTVLIGSRSTFEGNVHLACIEGKSIKIGKNCMFSANISLRTGDSHSIVNLQGQRINPSKDVSIGDHVWVGNTVLVTKGVNVLNDSIVGTGSVVTRCFTESNVVIAGNPAVIVKRNISWERKRLPL